MLRDLHQRLAAIHGHTKDDDDMKPVMMRALTDLFTSRPHHTAEEIAQFEEFGARLLDKVDAGTLAIVARKLAPYPLTPQPIIENLLERGGSAAATTLELAPQIERRRLIAAVAQGCVDSAVAVARRADIDDEIVTALCERPDIESLRALAENVAVTLAPTETRRLLARARDDAALARAMLRRNIPGRDAAPLFLHADKAMRAEILRCARAAGLGAIGCVGDESLSPTLAEIERYARDQDWSRFAFRLAMALALRIEDVRRVMGDASGEALAVALAAIGAPPSMAARVFMCREPAIAHSYPSVLELSGLVGSLTATEARDLLTRIFGEQSRPAAPTRRIGAHLGYYDQQAAAPGGAKRPSPHVAPGSGAAAMVSRFMQREN
jgi:uncharacterized protein (DUF2336 family)